MVEENLRKVISDSLMFNSIVDQVKPELFRNLRENEIFHLDRVLWTEIYDQMEENIADRILEAEENAKYILR